MGALAAILVSSAQHAAALTTRAGINGSVLNFSDGEALQAIAAVTQHRPPLIVQERFFAVTPRGAALVNRIKADPALADTEIRVLEHDSDYSRVIPRRRSAAAPEAAPAEPDGAPPTAGLSPDAGEPALDAEGTRIAPRLPVRAGAELKLDGSPVTLVDLSETGAQVISQQALKPNHQYQADLTSETETLQFEARVVWANFEAPEGTAQYRAGLAFGHADPARIDRFCAALPQA
ncbi:MAG: PilZ domain-containing protein [Vicinamibacterales bacterium]|nr:PilZ domain-containing protein [Vicinamibacterales bacterium]